MADPFRILAKLLSSRPLGVNGISSVAVKCVNIGKNTGGEGGFLGLY